MTLDQIGAFAESLDGVKRKGTAERPAWYVRDRLVARLVDPTTLLVRVPMDRREDLLALHPDGFGLPPRLEAHHKVLAYLDKVEPEAVQTAIRRAWEMQRR